MRNIDQLLKISSSAIVTENLSLKLDQLLLSNSRLLFNLNELLQRRNGFWAFEQALHIFPAATHPINDYDLISWNSNNLWKNCYEDMSEGLIFFGEDIFGSQFAISENCICRFDPETGQVEEIAADLEDWAGQIIQEYEVETGYPIANSWQQIYGSLPPKHRLVPKIPFVLGGEYVLENLYLANAVEGMKVRANLALQIRDLPDGSSIEFKIVE